MGLPPVGDNPIIAIGHPRFVAPYRMLTRYRRGGCGAQPLTDLRRCDPLVQQRLGLA